MTTSPSPSTPDPLHDVRGRLAGVLSALDPDQAPQAVTLVALVLDELVDPAQPPAPWQAAPPDDVARALGRVHDDLVELIRGAGSPGLSLKVGLAARHVDEARLALASAAGSAR